MSVLARARIPQLRRAASSRLHTSASVLSTPVQGSSRDFTNNPFLFPVTDKVSKGPPPPRRHDEFPPAAPSTAYPAARPPTQNPLRQAAEAAEELAAHTRPQYRVYVKATRNNCIITFTKPNGNPIRTFAGGMYGFKHVNRSTHEAAHQCAVHAFASIRDEAVKEPTMLVHLYMNGFGKGREAVQKAFLSTEGEGVRNMVCRVTDKTPIQIGGNRAKKIRRL